MLEKTFARRRLSNVTSADCPLVVEQQLGEKNRIKSRKIYLNAAIKTVLSI